MTDKIRALTMKNKYLKFILQPIYRLGQEPLKMRQNYIFRKYGLEALLKLKEALDSEGIIYWLEFGTLLGAYREKDFIAHDLDIDIGLFIENDHRKIEKALVKYGFKKQQQIEIDNGNYGLEQSYSYKGVTVDLFYFSKKDSIMYCHVFAPEYGKSWENAKNERSGLTVFEHSFCYNGFKEIVFLGHNFNIPKNEKEHLIAQYGEHFMIKNKQWNQYKMATNKKILDTKKGYIV